MKLFAKFAIQLLLVNVIAATQLSAARADQPSVAKDSIQVMSLNRWLCHSDARQVFDSP